MNEGITTRVARLISGSVNNIIDKAESISPEIVMKETIREVDSTIDEVKILLGKESVELRKTKQQLENEKSKYKNLTEQIEIAVSEDRDDLAKTAISRQMDIEIQVPVLEDLISNIEKNISKLENYIDALNAKKREMQKELEDFLKIKKEESSKSDIDINIENAEKAFNRVSSSIGSKYINDDEVKLAELDKLARDNRVLERLESIKASKK